MMQGMTPNIHSSDDNIRISVIITVKNGAKLIEKALISIASQTVLPDEIVIVDDGSDDDTCSVIESIQHKYLCGIRLIKTNGIGRAAALNLAVKFAENEWIANLDADDFWYPKKLEQQIKVILDNPSAANNVLICTGTTICIDELSLHEIKENRSFVNYHKINEKAFYFSNPVNHSSALFSKKTFCEAGGYNENLNKNIDYNLWFAFLANKTTFFKLDDPLTVKLIHKNQNFENKKRISYLLDSFRTKYLGLKLLKAPFYFYWMPLPSFVFGILPQKLRARIRG
jgi:glycosyltransferase involved in cell wall biosynthesis